MTDGILLVAAQQQISNWCKCANVLENEQKIENRETAEAPILKGEFLDKSLRTLKKGKSPVFDNIPAEILKDGRLGIIDVLTNICHQSPHVDQWLMFQGLDKVIDYSSSEKGNTRFRYNLRTITLISHSREVMLRVILLRLANQAKQISEEEQSGFISHRSTTTEQN